MLGAKSVDFGYVSGPCEHLKAKNLKTPKNKSLEINYITKLSESKTKQNTLWVDISLVKSEEILS